MVFATLPAIASYICFFYTPDTTKSIYKFAWYLVCYCLFQTFLTVGDVSITFIKLLKATVHVW